MRYIRYIILHIWQIFAIYIALCNAEENSETNNLEKPKILLDDIMKQSHLIEPSMKNLVMPLFDNQDLKGVAQNSLVLLYKNTLKILGMFREKGKALTDQFVESLFLIDPIREKISKIDFKAWVNRLLSNTSACTDKDGYFSIKEAIKNCPILKKAFQKDTQHEGTQDETTDDTKQDTHEDNIIYNDTQIIEVFSTIERISEAYEIGINAIAERTIEFVMELGVFDMRDGNLFFDQTVQLLQSITLEENRTLGARRLASVKQQTSSLLYTDESIREINQFEIDVDREKDRILKDLRFLLGFHQLKYDQIIIKKAVEKVGLENIKPETDLSNKLLTPEEYILLKILCTKYVQIEVITGRYKQRVIEILKALNSKIDAITFKSFKQRLYKYISDGIFKSMAWLLPEENTDKRRLSTRDDTMLYHTPSRHRESFISNKHQNADTAHIEEPIYKTHKDIIMQRYTEEKLRDEIPTLIHQMVADAYPENPTLASNATIGLRNFQTRVASLYHMLPLEFLNKNNLSHILNNSTLLEILHFLNTNVAKNWEDLPIPLGIIHSLKSDNTIMAFDTFVRKLDELNRVLQHHIDEANRYTISQLSRTGINLSPSDMTKLDQMMHTITSQYMHIPQKQMQLRRLTKEQDFDDDTLLIELIKSIIEIMQEYEQAIEELEEKLVENADISVVIYEHFKKYDPEYLKEIQFNKYFDISHVTGERRIAAEDAVEAIIHIYRGHLKALRAEILSIVEDNYWIIDTIGWERIELLQQKLETMMNEITPADAL